MSEKIIDGSKLSLDLRNEVKLKTELLKNNHNINVCLVVIIIGDDPASKIYVKNKNKFAIECGFNSIKIELPESTTEEELLQKIESCNQDPNINGILVQLPLPNHISKNKVINTISPYKDVDGFHLKNVGALFTGQVDLKKGLLPCTPKGCLMMIKKVLGENLEGKKAVVIGASNIVGRPMLALLLNEKCTVTITHSKTQNLGKELENAEIIVIGIGKAKFLKSNLIPQNAIIVDIGINRVLNQEGKSVIVGDADFNDVIDKVSFITPVPGGVGPMTIACLLQNTVIAACEQNNINYLSI
jgi:methylenetetrahydrofolate dehydrogenase (NADP+) / methenyltetrahydrofolate cyclohydrolase